MSLHRGQVVKNRYRADGLLGQGGYVSVYKAWDLTLERYCALKESSDISSIAEQQFKREAVMLANLNHPNLARVSDYFVVPNQGHYLVMDYIEGLDLGQLLEKSGNPLAE